MHFDYLQHQVKRLGGMLEAMTHAIDMADELEEAEKQSTGKVDYAAKAQRQSRCYELLEPIINAAIRQGGQVEEGLADYLKASPDLVAWLARWQSTTGQQ